MGGERATGTGAKLVEAETMESMVLRARKEAAVFWDHEQEKSAKLESRSEVNEMSRYFWRLSTAAFNPAIRRL